MSEFVKDTLQTKNPEHSNCFNNVKEFEWAEAFLKGELNAFQKIFHPEVTQTASTSPYDIFGREEVSRTFLWASKFYDRCDFIAQASSERVEFLEFDLTTKNQMHMTGMTVLTKDESNKIIKVFNGHRNLLESVLFSEHFARGPRNQGIVSLFHKRALSKYGLETKYHRNVFEIDSVSSVDESEYIDAFRDSSETAFCKILDENVLLSSSYVVRPIEGIRRVSKTMSLVSKFYEHCLFTNQGNFQNKTYLLYKGRLRNGLLVSDGFLILERNNQGKIKGIYDNPIPLHAGTLISAFLAKRFADKDFASRYFYSDELFRRAAKHYSMNGVIGSETRNLSFLRGFLAKLMISV